MAGLRLRVHDGYRVAVERRNVYRAFDAAARKAGIVDALPHTLRHSAATLMLEGGEGIKTVSDALGHSSIAITGDIYGHTSDDAARRAAATLDAALGL